MPCPMCWVVRAAARYGSRGCTASVGLKSRARRRPLRSPPSLTRSAFQSRSGCIGAERAAIPGKRRGSRRNAVLSRVHRRSMDRVRRRWNTLSAPRLRRSSALGGERRDESRATFIKNWPMPIPFHPSPGVPSSSSAALAGRSRRPTIVGSRSSPRAAGRNRCCWRWCTSAREPRGDSSGAGSRRRRGVRGFRRTFRTPTRVGVGRAASRTRTERVRVSYREGNSRRGRASTWRTSSCAGARAREKLRKSRKSRVTRRSRLEVSGDPSAPGSLRARTRWYDAWCGVRGADGPSRVRRCWIPRRSRSPRGDREAARDATGAWGFTNCHTTSGSVP